MVSIYGLLSSLSPCASGATVTDMLIEDHRAHCCSSVHTPFRAVSALQKVNSAFCPLNKGYLGSGRAATPAAAPP